MKQIKQAMRSATLGDVIGTLCLVGGWVVVGFVMWGFQP